MTGGRRAAAGEGQDALQDGQGEGSGLAGPGLRPTHDVLASNHQGNRFRLDRGRFAVAEIVEGT